MMKKGFSVFTPLVGTAVIVIAILLSSVMMQNDVRLSRGISASYEVSSQTIAAKLIEAAANVKIVKNLGEITENYLADPPRNVYDISNPDGIIDVVCATPHDTLTLNNKIDDCKDKILKKFTGVNNMIVVQSTTGGGGIYAGVTDNIEATTSYELAPGYTCTFTGSCTQPTAAERLDCCLSFAMGDVAQAVITSWEGDELKVTIDSAKLATVSDAFIITFRSQSNPTDTVSLDITPMEFSYVTEGYNLKNEVESAATAFGTWAHAYIEDPCTRGGISGSSDIDLYRKKDATTGDILAVRMDVSFTVTNGDMEISFRNQSSTSGWSHFKDC